MNSNTGSQIPRPGKLVRTEPETSVFTSQSPSRRSLLTCRVDVHTAENQRNSGSTIPRRPVFGCSHCRLESIVDMQCP